MNSKPLRSCLRPPVPEVATAAIYLQAAVSAHVLGSQETARHFIVLADIPAIREWMGVLLKKPRSYVSRLVPGVPPVVAPRGRERMHRPFVAMIQLLHSRDGYQCRFCGIPVIREAVLAKLRQLYPSEACWGPKGIDRHAALQAMRVQYDFIVPHSRGGKAVPDNLVVTCTPCAFARRHYTLDQVGLEDPRKRKSVRTSWDGLERILLLRNA
jgi:hypothetical protein